MEERINKILTHINIEKALYNTIKRTLYAPYEVYLDLFDHHPSIWIHDKTNPLYKKMVKDIYTLSIKDSEPIFENIDSVIEEYIRDSTNIPSFIIYEIPEENIIEIHKYFSPPLHITTVSKMLIEGFYKIYDINKENEKDIYYRIFHKKKHLSTLKHALYHRAKIDTLINTNINSILNTISKTYRKIEIKKPNISYASDEIDENIEESLNEYQQLVMIYGIKIPFIKDLEIRISP